MEQALELQPVGETAHRPTRRSLLVAWALAAGAAATLQLTLGDLNINFADEGYLWYGVRAVLRGEVPFRDFQAYDPGRYYWCAAFSPIFGSGILGVRAAVAAFQAVGLAAGLLVARRLFRRDLALVPVAALLALWMFPRHKLFEPAIALLFVHGVVRFLERPTPTRSLLLGLLVGLGAFFGRNHGLYGGVAALAAFGIDAWTRRGPDLRRNFLALSGGIVAGYLPMLAMLAFVPGFATAFWHALAELATKGANIPKPYPWPWRADYSGLHGLELAGEVATTAAFALPVLVVPLAVFLSLRCALRARRARTSGDAQHAPLHSRAVLVGSTLVGAIYLHHVSVRSDVPHLGQCFAPVVLVLLALARRPLARSLLWSSFAILSAFAILENHTTLRWFSPWRSPTVVAGKLGDESMRFIRPQAAYLAGLEEDVAARLGPEDEILIAPSRPTLYPLLGRAAPIHGIYLFWFASDAEQEAILDALEARKVRFALIVDTAVDDREDLRFSNTYPRVFAYLLEHYRRVPTPHLRPDHFLFERRSGGRRTGGR